LVAFLSVQRLRADLLAGGWTKAQE
jgi:hypothetical protein